MLEDKRQDIFGYNSRGKVSELQNINTDAWPLISGSNLQTERKKQTPPTKKEPAKAGKRSSAPQKKAEEKKKTPYVSSSTGKAQKKKPDKNEGRILKPPADISPRFVKGRKENKATETVNTKKGQPERTPKGQRVEDKTKQPKRPSGRPSTQQRPKEQLSKSRQKQIIRENANYERATRQNKSKDELRREYQIRQIKSRKRKNALGILCFVLGATIAFGIFIYNNVAIVSNINIEGNSTYSMQKIIKNCGVLTGDKLLSVREKRVKEILTKELPYIKDVSIGYDFPDTLVITVTPTTDKLMISHKNKYIRVDSDGKVVAVSKTKMKDGLFKVEGLTYKKHTVGEFYSPAEGEESKYEMAKSIVKEAEKAGLLSGIVNVKEMDKITFTYDGRIRIYFGNAGELQSKMEFAAKTIAQAAPDKQTGYIDMRFSERGYFSEGSMDNT